MLYVTSLIESRENLFFFFTLLLLVLEKFEVCCITLEPLSKFFYFLKTFGKYIFKMVEITICWSCFTTVLL